MAAFAEHRDDTRAEAMSAYMRDRFSFFGIRSADRVAIQRRAFGERPRPEVADVVGFARLAWQREERECQYAACDLIRKHVGRLGPSELPTLGELIRTRSWWDTVDVLAVAVGAIVRVTPAARSVMDEWLADPDMWLVRVAILHQERWRSATDAAWLFAACRAQAAHTDFFIRKAIGWALRSYAKSEPGAVQAFLEAHGSELSGLSRREAERGVVMGFARVPPLRH